MIQKFMEKGLNIINNGPGGTGSPNGSTIPPHGMNPALNGWDIIGISTILAIIIGIANICSINCITLRLFEKLQTIKIQIHNGSFSLCFTSPTSKCCIHTISSIKHDFRPWKP